MFLTTGGGPVHAKQIGALWGQLQPSERQQWEAQAAQAKAEYKEALTQMVRSVTILHVAFCLLGEAGCSPPRWCIHLFEMMLQWYA